MVKYGYMISIDTFIKSLESGDITKLNFTYESKEYLIVREEREVTEDGEAAAPVFAFASEEHTAVRFPTPKELLKTVKVGGVSLYDVWEYVVPICSDTLLDDDYVETLYGDSLGEIMRSASGTATSYNRYLSRHLAPSIVFFALAIVALVLSTLLISAFTWTFFGVAAAIAAAVFAALQVIFVSNTNKYRHGNPRAHCYLLSRGAVIVTDRYEYAIPYEKIIRLHTEAGIKIVTMKTIFSFIPNHGDEFKESLKYFFEEGKSIKRVFKKKKKN